MDIFDELKEKLQETKLSENETGVYVTLLRIGKSTTGRILKEYDMSSGKIYYILNKLIKKGLVSYVIKNNIKYFKSQCPENILEYLENEKKKIDNKEMQIKKLLPEILDSIKTEEEDISVEIYEGMDGFKTGIFRFMDEHNYGDTEYEFDNFSSGIEKEFPMGIKIAMQMYSKKMIKKNITALMLLSTTNKKLINEAKKIMKGTNYKIRYIENQKFASILFGKGRTLILDYSKPSLVYIKNKRIADSFIKMFESLWLMGKDI